MHLLYHYVEFHNLLSHPPSSIFLQLLSLSEQESLETGPDVSLSEQESLETGPDVSLSEQESLETGVPGHKLKDRTCLNILL